MVRERESFILEQAILHAIKNPPQPVIDSSVNIEEVTEDSPVIQPVDFFAFHDSINLMHDMFAEKRGEVVKMSSEDLLTQKDIETALNAIYIADHSEYVNQDEDSDILIAAHHRILLTKEVSVDGFKSEVGRLVGVNNLNNSTETFMKGKGGLLIQPYELTTIVSRASLGGVDVRYAYEQNPFHACFTHVLSPSPVMGYALEGNIKQLIGYVVHAKMLYNLLSSAEIISAEKELEEFKLKDHMALQYDTQTALRLLEHRYRIEVDQESVDRIADFDKKLERYSEGACCIEFPHF